MSEKGNPEIQGAYAEALRISFERLRRMGWRHSPTDIGNQAAWMINAMMSEIKSGKTGPDTK